MTVSRFKAGDSSFTVAATTLWNNPTFGHSCQFKISAKHNC